MRSLQAIEDKLVRKHGRVVRHSRVQHVNKRDWLRVWEMADGTVAAYLRKLDGTYYRVN